MQQTDQLPLFQRKNFSATLTQSLPITPPGPESSVLSTLPAYFAYLQSQGYSPYTPSDFCGDVKKFGLFLPQKKLGDITTPDIRSWVSQLRSKEKMTDKTISRKLSAVTNYFTWLACEKIIADNPALSIPNSKVISPLPEILFEEECSRLLKTASADSRTYLLILLLLETGIKIEELMNLTINDLDISNTYSPEVWVKHSGKKITKDRKLKLPRELAPVLKDYTTTYSITGPLFPYSQRFVRYLLTAAGDKAKITKKVSTHLLRDTCAVRLIKAGEPIETVLKKLGLSETTWEDAKEKYLKLTSKAL